LDLPLRNLLKEGLYLSPPEMAVFFALGGLPWYFKPVAGLLSDSTRLFGTRRRHYLVFSAVLAGALWLVLGSVPRSYVSLLLAVIATNCMLVVGSTVVGALLVDAEKRLVARGRLVSVRVCVDSFCMIAAGPLAGILAGLPFSVAATIGAAIAITVVPVALIFLHEPRVAADKGVPLSEAYDRLKTVAGSRLLWMTALFLFAASIPQEFSTPLYYHQRDQLQLPVETIGWLKSVGGFGSVCAAIVYGVVGRRVPLRSLLVLGILCAAAGALSYVLYRSLAAAVAVEFVHGFLFTLGGLVFMELAVWATPRGAAAMGFSLFMSALNGGTALGDVLGSTLIGQWPLGLYGLAAIYAAATASLLGGLRFLPATLFTRGESGVAVRPTPVKFMR